MGIENDIKSLNEQIADLKRDLNNEKNKNKINKDLFQCFLY